MSLAAVFPQLRGFHLEQVRTDPDALIALRALYAAGAVVDMAGTVIQCPKSAPPPRGRAGR